MSPIAWKVFQTFSDPDTSTPTCTPVKDVRTWTPPLCNKNKTKHPITILCRKSQTHSILPYPSRKFIDLALALSSNSHNNCSKVGTGYYTLILSQFGRSIYIFCIYRLWISISHIDIINNLIWHQLMAAHADINIW